MIKAKKGQILTDKVLMVIVGVIVLLAALGFMFKANLQQWINNLPGYTPPEDKEIDVTQQPGDKTVVSRLCPVEVGKVGLYEHISSNWFAQVLLESDEQYLYVYYPGTGGKGASMQRTLVYWDGSVSEAVLRVKQSGGDDIIGFVRGRIIGIYQEVIDQSGPVYDEVKDELPANELLRNLNGAYYYQSNKLCRASEVKLP